MIETEYPHGSSLYTFFALKRKQTVNIFQFKENRYPYP